MTIEHDQAAALLQQADKDFADRRYRQAYVTMSQGVALIGERFYRPGYGVIGDSGMIFGFARSEFRLKHFRSAALLLRMVLDGRLDEYRRLQLKDCVSGKVGDGKTIP